MYLSPSETKWVKFGKPHDFVFVGKETIATASGIYVSFLDLNTGERRVERFDSKERGDGASGLAGHSTVSMFSVVERRLNPKISVFMYPTLQRISKCALPDRVNGYLSCSFAGTEYLLSLTSFPDFRLIVWHWKTGKHVAALSTKIDNLVQEIHCSPNSPHMISQLGTADGTLSIYQVRTCSKIVSIHHVDVPLPERKIVSSSWTPEGNLFVSDELGNVWLIAIEANKLYPVIKSETHKPPKHIPIVVTYKSGVIIANANSKITFYRKSSTDWSVSWRFAWSISTAFYSIQAAKRHYFRDGIFFHSRSGEIFEITTQHDNIPRIEVIYTDDIEYKALFSISRCADHVAAIDRLDRLYIFELSTGKLVARLSLKHHGEVLRTDSHPNLSMLASCSGTGNCVFIDVTSVSSPKIFNCFHLHEGSLDRMKFSRRGEFLAVGDSHTGRIFIIAKRFEQCVDVLGLVEIDGHITDFLIYERNDDRFEILVLATTDSSLASIGGNKAILYTCETSSDFLARAVCVIDLSRSFRMLYHEPNKPLSILGVPSLSKQLHQMEIQNDFQNIVLTEALSSMHQMRNVGVYATDSRIVTYGYDGLIVVRDGAEPRKAIAIFMPHHRSKGGIRFAICSRLGETIVSLGRNGDLVASRVRCLPETRGDFVKTEAVSAHLSTRDFAAAPRKFRDSAEGAWLDSVIAAKLKAERDEALSTRASIVADLKGIKNRIRELLDTNESKSPDARLPISAFDLDRESRRRKVREARLERDELRRSLEEECAERDRAASRLREIFWTPLRVKPRALRSVGGDTTVENYPLVAWTRSTSKNDLKVWDRLSSDADEFLYSYDVYNGPVNEGDDSRRASTAASLEEGSSSPTDKDGGKVPEMAETWYTSVDEAERSCISGVTTHRWIEDESVASTHQLLVPCDSDLDDILKKDAIVENRERKLKMHFNDLFEETRRAKERELKRAKERIDRLRYCASELKTMFGVDSVLEPIEIPTWTVEETPDYVVTVEDREIFERRGEYGIERVDEDQENGKESEGSSDFRARALEKMMDGVLEPKWQDEVKKDVPVPECLIAKDPSKYTDDDVTIIASYKSKVRALREEREKYKAMLQTEIVETRDALRQDVTLFDDKLRDLEVKQTQLECAILQERLMRIRAIQRHRAAVDGGRELARLADQVVAPAGREARRLAEECGTLEVVVSELKARYDGLCKTERRQEARFRGEFADLKQPMVEHLIRHYRKRPRTGRPLTTTTSVTYLTEVARCVACGERSEILPRECLDFLGAVDALDAMPGNLPPKINADRWRTMCRLRRAKIEVETKVRCCAVEMAEAEQTLSFYQRTAQSVDNVAACKRIELNDTEKSLARLAQETEVQLVLRTGQIEVPLRGCPADYADAVLVTREELVRVNDCIRETGKRKLAAMRESMHLRKVVSRHEWRHARARMLLDDLRQELKDVRQFKITRNVLEFLTRSPYSVNLEEDYEKMRGNMRAFKNKFRKLLELERARAEETKRLMAKWRKKNDKMSQATDSRSSGNEKRRGSLLNDPCRKRDEESRRMRLTAIARRTRLVAKVEDNYEQLLTLHAHLEVLKLRTYPTLRFKTA